MGAFTKPGAIWVLSPNRHTDCGMLKNVNTYIHTCIQYITKIGPFSSLGLFFSNCNSCIGGFGPFETLGDHFPRGPQGLVPSTSGIIYPALDGRRTVDIGE